MKFIAGVQQYLTSITLPGDDLPFVKSRRKTGFIGFLICCKSLQMMIEMLIVSSKPVLNYLLTYRMTQDHIELFFLAKLEAWEGSITISQLDSSQLPTRRC